MKVVGTYTPPFRPLNAEEEAELIRMVAETKPDFFWVGLSTPKQERFMDQYLSKLDAKLMFGVGAAFDIHTGRIKDAPYWMKVTGVQWMHRILSTASRSSCWVLRSRRVWESRNQPRPRILTDLHG